MEGRIQTGSYEGQDGKRVYTTDVVVDSVQFLEPRNGQASQNNDNTGQYQQNYTRVDEDPFNDKPIDVQGDDLPF